MPTSSQSQILSVVDYQLLQQQQQQQSNGQTTKSTARTTANQPSTIDSKRRSSIDKKNENNHSLPSSSAYVTDRRRSLDKANDSKISIKNFVFEFFFSSMKNTIENYSSRKSQKKPQNSQTFEMFTSRTSLSFHSR